METVRTAKAYLAGKTRMIREGASSYTVRVFDDADDYRTPRAAPPCSQCRGDGQVCNACGRPGAECRCPDDRLPTPKACPGCGGRPTRKPRKPALVRLHWWCMRQATRFDRPGYPLLAHLFDWVGGRAADLHRATERRGPMKDFRVRGTVTPDDQLRRWADGDPVCPNTAGECCPDFSCCRPHLLWPEEKRRRFVAADPKTRNGMLAGALASLVDDAGVKARVISDQGGARSFTPPLVGDIPSSRTPPPRRRRP